MLDGPRLPARNVAVASLVVLIHGYGANGDDLISLGEEWRDALPDTAFVSPDAPEEIPGYPMGRQWFALFDRTPDEFWSGVRRAGPMLDAFIDTELERHRLTPDRLALVGFSQGTMMALHVGLRRRQPLAGLVGYSGRLAGASDLASGIATRPPVLLVHGMQDDIIPVIALAEAEAALRSIGVDVAAHARPGLGHGIDREGLKLGSQFLVNRLAR